MCKTSAAKLTLSYDTLAPHITFSLLMQQKLLSAFVRPKLDYCISLLYGSPMYVLQRHKKVQNSAARQIFQCCKNNHISPLLTSLLWLPIKTCIDYKLPVICLVLSIYPITYYYYLSDLLSVCTPKRIYTPLQTIEFYVSINCEQRRFWHRSFSLTGPTIWNSLPTKLRHTDSIHKFKSAIKTHLLRKFYT